MDSETVTTQSRGKILIVEDDAFLESLVAQKMKQHAFTILAAKDGEHALSVIEKETPDLILLDIMLPGMSGLQILEKIKSSEKTKAIRVIMLSNLSQQNDIDKAMKLGAEDYWVKANTSPNDIAEKVGDLLG